jgi:(p)ppGpp synthase/HD superfamily hydrolase
MNDRQRCEFNADFERALIFATRLHGKQVRKGASIPYVSHLMAVASLVLEHGSGRDEAIAALLHDSIEDQGREYPGGVAALREEIKTQFGERVLEIVDADAIPKSPWRERVT